MADHGTDYLVPRGNPGTAKPIAAIELGALVAAVLTLVFGAETATARPGIPLAISAAVAAAAAGHRSDEAACRRLWVAASAAWLAVVVMVLDLLTA
ncbi:MAG: hypothetical protein D6689_19790 [Deltaproteobacteria bacterium]|nr:MAG: hypothetical protein D6689_19790 [Deltaproteobacteria bacterium]